MAYRVARAGSAFSALLAAPNGAHALFLDKYFTGWVDPAKLKLLDYATLAELVSAYVDDASHAAGGARALKILDRRAMAD